MIAQWPMQNWYPRRASSDAARMLTLLTQLDDTALIERFLTEVTAAGHYDKGDNPAILAALDRLPPLRAKALIERIVAGTAITLGADADLLARAAATWGRERAATLAGAATRLVEALPGDPAARAASQEPWQRPSRVDPRVIIDLLTGLSLSIQCWPNDAWTTSLLGPRPTTAMPSLFRRPASWSVPMRHKAQRQSASCRLRCRASACQDCRAFVTASQLAAREHTPLPLPLLCRAGPLPCGPRSPDLGPQGCRSRPEPR